MPQTHNFPFSIDFHVNPDLIRDPCLMNHCPAPQDTPPKASAVWMAGQARNDDTMPGSRAPLHA